MRDRSPLAAGIAVGLLLGVAPPAAARDRVPSNRQARAYHLRTFGPVAPTHLLGNARGRQYRTARLRVPLSGCHRTPVQNVCGFHALLKRRRGVPAAFHAPISCKGELWSKLVDGHLIARVGDYKCVTADA